ncbi:hypothetical protein JKP88DRAFT_245819 [Tribonema minus]|uniref:Uncharacterized protein n=1 Tax=Tribonema minus TaxID=303371 RepID=A0A836CDY2_9STRA|nr:hypothetical protein JKP88DRAFT_245819 [Tribonema minus]
MVKFVVTLSLILALAASAAAVVCPVDKGVTKVYESCTSAVAQGSEIIQGGWSNCCMQLGRPTRQPVSERSKSQGAAAAVVNEHERPTPHPISRSAGTLTDRLLNDSRASSIGIAPA